MTDTKCNPTPPTLEVDKPKADQIACVVDSAFDKAASGDYCAGYICVEGRVTSGGPVAELAAYVFNLDDHTSIPASPAELPNREDVRFALPKFLRKVGDEVQSSFEFPQVFLARGNASEPYYTKNVLVIWACTGNCRQENGDPILANFQERYRIGSPSGLPFKGKKCHQTDCEQDKS